MKHINCITVFEFEKSYIFISKIPALILYQKALKCILDSKRLNLISNLNDFCCLFISEIVRTFNENNQDEVSQQRHYYILI